MVVTESDEGVCGGRCSSSSGVDDDDHFNPALAPVAVPVPVPSAKSEGPMKIYILNIDLHA